VKNVTGLAPVLVWMAIIFALSAQPRLPSPENQVLEILLEKLSHAFEYAVLAALATRAWDVMHGRPRFAFGFGVLVACVYALSDEFHQTFVPGRSADWTDLGFDWAGAVIGAWLWQRARKASQAKAPPEDARRQV
jgi:VanZ family protein